MARKKNTVPTVDITIKTTPRVRADLTQLVKTHYYGKNEAEAAEELLRGALRGLMEEPIRLRRAPGRRGGDR